MNMKIFVQNFQSSPSICMRGLYSGIFQVNYLVFGLITIRSLGNLQDSPIDALLCECGYYTATV